MELSDSFCGMLEALFVKPLNLHSLSGLVLIYRSACRHRKQFSPPKLRAHKHLLANRTSSASLDVIPPPTCLLIILTTAPVNLLIQLFANPTTPWSTAWLFERPMSCKRAPASTSCKSTFMPFFSSLPAISKASFATSSQ